MVNLIQDTSSILSEPQTPAKFTFTKLADTGNDFTSFGNIALNNQGVVAFSAGKQGSELTGIYTSNGQGITTIADLDTLSTLLGDVQPALLVGPPSSTETPKSYFFDGNFAINNVGNVFFGAGVNFPPTQNGYYQSASKRLFLTQGDTINLVRSADDVIGGSSFSTTNSYAGLGVNDRGQTVYSIETTDVNPRRYTHITVFVDGRSIASGYIGPGAPTSQVYSPVINNQGTVFYAESGSVASNSSEVDVTNIYKLGSEDSKPVAVGQRLSATSLAANDRGTIVFSGSIPSGKSGIFEIDDGVITTVSDRSGKAKINNFGEIAFQPSPSGTDATGIFTTSGAATEKVIAPGDPLLDSTVTKVQFGGLNDLGEVAFVAELADGTKGVFRADPLTTAYYTGTNSDTISPGLGGGNISTPMNAGFGDVILTQVTW